MAPLRSRRGLVVSAVLFVVVLAVLDLLRPGSLLRSVPGWFGAEERQPGLQRLERRFPFAQPRRP